MSRDLSTPPTLHADHCYNKDDDDIAVAGDREDEN